MNVSLEKTIILILSILIIPSLITPVLTRLISCNFWFNDLYIKKLFKKRSLLDLKQLSSLLFFYLILHPINTTFRNPTLSFESSLFYFRYLFFTLSIIFYFCKYKIATKLVYFSIIFSFIILISDSLYQLINGTNITGYAKYQGQVNSFFGENKDGILGSYMSRILPIYLSLHYFLNPKQKVFEFIKYLFIFITVIICILSGERAAFIYAIITFIFYLLFIEENFKTKFFILTTVLISICISFIYEKQYYERFILLSKML